MMRTLAEYSKWAAYTAEDIKSSFGGEIEGVYLALIPFEGNWSIEVEINDGTISHVCESGTGDLGVSRIIADEIDRVFSEAGIKVFKTRDEWDDALEQSYNR